MLKEFKTLNYDLSKGHKTIYQGREVFVVGADNASEEVNQFWVDLEHLYMVRVITYDEENKTDGRYGGFEKIGDAWTETEVIFYINNKLYQVEYYSDWKADVQLPEGLFSLSSFGKVHWMSGN